MDRHWVIGDVHGCYHAMDSLLGLLPETDHLVFCGDVVGRGAKVLSSAERVWSLVCSGRATWLQGNHEQRLSHDSSLQQVLWPDQPEVARQWAERLQALPLMFQGNGWVATHAGFNADDSPNLEIREPFWTTYDGRFGQVVVAHTPGLDVRRHGQIVLIDTGAVYGGRLTAFCPETDAVVQVLGENHTDPCLQSKVWNRVVTQTLREPQPTLATASPC
ncbi:MAG: metallophosphoesterase [Synechococcus sp.]